VAGAGQKATSGTACLGKHLGSTSISLAATDTMRFTSAGILSACLLLAACATSSGQQLRKLLLGQWEHTVGIFGERRTSQLTFEADGTFLQAGYSEARGSRIGYVLEQGTWSLNGSTLEMRYRTAQSGAQAAHTETDVRRIEKLSEGEFVSTDTKFGIELAYTRSKSP